MHKLEKRTYGPDSTDQEIALLKKQVTVVDDNVIYFKQVAYPSHFQLSICCEEIILKMRNTSSFYLIVDISDIQKLSDDTKKELKHWYFHNGNKIAGMVLVFGKNEQLAMTIKMLLMGLVKIPHPGFKKREDAINIIHKLKTMYN